MSNSEEKWRRPIINSIKYRFQYIESNKINGDFGKIAKEKPMCRSYWRLKYVGKRGLNEYTVKSVFTKSTNSEGLYITHHISMMITNLVDISVRLIIITHKSQV